ncbi:MAG: hypothetical protein FJ318_03800 [SAR202 cluster bacterium]|nr:hypothetical protein [SAR202 cluster bacterium]
MVIRAWSAAVLALLALVLAACASLPATPPVITASVLVEPAPGDARWFDDVQVPAGTDGYQLLVAATGGQVKADWFPQFRSHFVKRILGIEPPGTRFWGAFIWNETTMAWEPLPVGADLFSVKQGHIMAWAVVEYSPDRVALPASTP